MAKKTETKIEQDIGFTRTDETLRFSWETRFAELKPGEVLKLEDQDFSKARSRALAYTNKTGTVLEVGRKDGVTLVRLAPKGKAA